MSPEQLRGKRLTLHADLWSLAAVMYEMLTGNRLLTGLSTGEIKHAVMNNSFQVSDKVPGEWQVFFRKCFAMDINARYNCAVTLAESFAGLTNKSID